MANDPRRRIEVGPWFHAGTKLSGEEAYEILKARSRTPSSVTPRYCIYVHIPFCLSRCKYCALYTFEVKKKKREIFDGFLEMMKRAVATHPHAGFMPPPTTVHFGGGTPLCLGMDRMAELVRALKQAFGNDPAGEWAVETTTSSIDGRTVAALQELGFRRIHLGIQTLDDDIRRREGRRETAAKAIGKIGRLLEKGFRLSVDLIIGLENTTPKIVRDDLLRLYENGVRMYSFCELRAVKGETANRAAAEREMKRNYGLWRRIWDFMRERELKPIHLGQFGRSDEDNLYYTHPARGEFCVALGPYAHGSSERIAYGNKLLGDYHQALETGLSPVAFAVRYSDAEMAIRRFESTLLAHAVPEYIVAEMRAVYGSSFDGLWNRWLEEGDVISCPKTATVPYTLSCHGSWFVGNLIVEARRLADTLRTS